jgi:hypothetical protein
MVLVVSEHATCRVAVLLSFSYLLEGVACKGRLFLVASCWKLLFLLTLLLAIRIIQIL